jgi:alkylation response protein AidB-like acyl-CoA dehydrogenase
MLQECVQLHGGIGVTWEHDLHLFLRRATLYRSLFGTPEEHNLRAYHLAEVSPRADWGVEAAS